MPDLEKRQITYFLVQTLLFAEYGAKSSILLSSLASPIRLSVSPKVKCMSVREACQIPCRSMTYLRLRLQALPVSCDASRASWCSCSFAIYSLYCSSVYSIPYLLLPLFCPSPLLTWLQRIRKQ